MELFLRHFGCLKHELEGALCCCDLYILYHAANFRFFMIFLAISAALQSGHVFEQPF